jgi:hypothetical protein
VIPLTYLTNAAVCKYTLSIISGSSNTKEYRLNRSGTFSATTKALLPDGEAGLGVSKWTAAWQHLLQLIWTHMEEEYIPWLAHFSYVLSKEDALNKDWGLWIRYNIKICQQLITTPFDIGVFQEKIFQFCKSKYNSATNKETFDAK